MKCNCQACEPTESKNNVHSKRQKLLLISCFFFFPSLKKIRNNCRKKNPKNLLFTLNAQNILTLVKRLKQEQYRNRTSSSNSNRISCRSNVVFCLTSFRNNTKKIKHCWHRDKIDEDPFVVLNHLTENFQGLD